jgi:tetratricopeptide (TPR) repeat protein
LDSIWRLYLQKIEFILQIYVGDTIRGDSDENSGFSYFFQEDHTMRNISIFKFSCFFLPILMATQFALADLADDMNGAEKLYEAGKYSQAEQGYQNIINKADPNKSEDFELAFQARKKLPLVYLAMDQQSQAQAAVQQLLTKNHDHEQLPQAIHEIVEQAKELSKTLQAGQIYQNILQIQPKHPQAIWLKMGIAIANVHLSNDEAVNATLQNIIAQDSGDERAAEAFNQTALAYRKLNKYAKARNVYQFVVDNWPNMDRAIFSQQGLVLCNIDLDDQAAADTATQKLLVDYAGSTNIPEIMLIIGEEYSLKGKPDKALTIHQYVLDKHPDSPIAVWSQGDKALCYLELGDKQTAKAATQELMQKFAGDTNISYPVWKIALFHNDKRDWEDARPLCEYLVDKHAEVDISIWAQNILLHTYLTEKNMTAIDTGIQQLLTRFSSNKQLPEAAYWVARDLSKTYPAKARELSEYISETYPDDEFTLYSKVNLCVLQILQDNETSAEAAFNTILSKNKDNPNLAEAVHLMAEGYFERALMEPRQNRQMTEKAKESLQKAQAKWEGIITQFPNTPSVAQAHYLVGECCYQLGQYEKAIEYYQKTVDNFPDYKNAWLAQSMIVKIYKFMLIDGNISQHEAESEMKAAYEKLIANFPDCPIAGSANKWLERYANATEGGQK